MALRISKEFKIGLFGIVAFVILYMGFYYLKGQDFFMNTKKYYAVYDNIDGLTLSNSVYVKGLTVGKVSNIYFQQEKGRIIVEMDIDGNIKLGDSSVAYLRNESFLGGKAIDLQIPDKIKKPMTEGDTLYSTLALGIMESITQKTLPVADDLGALIRRFNTILESFQTTELVMRETILKISSTFQTTESMIKENRESLKQSLDNIEKVTRNLDQTTLQLKPLFTNANSVVDSLQAAHLAETIKNMNLAINNLNGILRKLNEGQGSAGKLLHDDSLYVNLNRSAADLDKLLIDLHENPGRYVHVSVFGKSDKKK